MMRLSKSILAKMMRRSLRKIILRLLCELLATSKVHARSLEEGDLVLQRIQSAKSSNKLTPKWEGTYRVIRVTRLSAVRLETEDAIPVSNSWNIEYLRKFYP